MELGIKGNLFVVTGATSGFGKAIMESLINEGAIVIVNARGKERLQELQKKYPNQIEIIAGDITTDATLSNLVRKIGARKLHGIVINAGEPPANSFLTTELADWDDAYSQLLRWKVKLIKLILPLMEKKKFGRLIFIEKVSIKQSIENLTLSNSLRMAVIGFVKSLAQEVAPLGITCNILAPGYNKTLAIEERFGEIKEFASLATWLLSEKSGYITGQTISTDALKFFTFGSNL